MLQWCITNQQEVVVLRLRPQILKYDLLHEPLHEIPILHDTVSDRPLHAKTQRFIHNEHLIPDQRHGVAQKRGFV